jgi:hypothetical protein
VPSSLNNGRRSLRKLLRTLLLRLLGRVGLGRFVTGEFDLEYEPDTGEGRIRAASYLTILNHELPPEELARLVGMQPDEKWTRGERGKVGPVPLVAARFNEVDYASGLGDFATPTQHFASLIERLRPFALHIAAVADLQSTQSVRVWIVEHTERDNVDTVTEPEDLVVVAAMHAELVFSSYFGW